MKSLVLSSVVAAIVVFSGCSSKEAMVDKSAANQGTTKEVKSVASETVTKDNAIVTSEDNSIKVLTKSDIEAKLLSVYFAFDKYSIPVDGSVNVSTDVTTIKSDANGFGIKLEGNCDEWGSDEYNFALGLKRATSVKKALVAEGIAASRISVISYGESNPVCSDKTQDCWAKNRRVDFSLIK